MTEATTIIAEIGENHVGDWDRAEQMIEAAADAGADIVKFQTYWGEDVADTDEEKEWFSRVEVPDDVHFRLQEVAEQHDVEFLSSCFSLERAEFLVEDLGLDRIKVASSEMVNYELLSYLNDRVDSVFISTGLATLEEVKTSLTYLEDVDDVCVMQCTSQYPCPPREANLDVLETYKAEFPNHRVGYSDHTIGTLAPTLAAAKGAEVIEKHFTLDKSLEGTDHVLSVTPGELQELVGKVRQVETLLGTAEKQPTPGEREIVDDIRGRFETE